MYLADNIKFLWFITEKISANFQLFLKKWALLLISFYFNCLFYNKEGENIQSEKCKIKKKDHLLNNQGGTTKWASTELGEGKTQTDWSSNEWQNPSPSTKHVLFCLKKERKEDIHYIEYERFYKQQNFSKSLSKEFHFLLCMVKVKYWKKRKRVVILTIDNYV